MHYISKMTVLGADKGRISIYKNVTCLSNYLYIYLICLDMYLTDRIKKKYCKFASIFARFISIFPINKFYFHNQDGN